MKIRMLCDKDGSVDGVVIMRYLAGQEYDMTKTIGHVDLAKTFVSQNWAVVVATDKQVIDHDKQIENSAERGTGEPDRGEVKLKVSRNKR